MGVLMRSGLKAALAVGGMICALTIVYGMSGERLAGTSEIGGTVDSSWHYAPFPERLAKEEGAAVVETFREDIEKARKEKPFATNFAKAVATPVIESAKEAFPKTKEWGWTVDVIEASEPNAFCAPGGRIVVTSGLLDLLEGDSDALGIIIGHEVAHALLEHGRRGMSKGWAAKALVWTVARSLKMGETRTNAFTAGLAALMVLPDSRHGERESDELGMELSHRAGFDVRAYERLWRRMSSAKEESAADRMISTHPQSEERLALGKATAERIASTMAARPRMVAERRVYSDEERAFRTLFVASGHSKWMNESVRVPMIGALVRAGVARDDAEGARTVNAALTERGGFYDAALEEALRNMGKEGLLAFEKGWKARGGGAFSESFGGWERESGVKIEGLGEWRSAMMRMRDERRLIFKGLLHSTAKMRRPDSERETSALVESFLDKGERREAKKRKEEKSARENDSVDGGRK